MARPIKEIEQQLLRLPQAQRVRLTHPLIVRLHEGLPSDEGTKAAWIDEAKQCDAEIERGGVKALLLGEAMPRLSEALKKNNK